MDTPMTVTQENRPRYEVPFERGGIIEPGRPILQPGTERYIIPGGGSRTIPISEGDEIGILNLEGNQAVEMILFNHEGKSDAGFLGTKGTGKPNGTIALIKHPLHGQDFPLDSLQKMGIDIEDGDAVLLHGQDTPAGQLDRLYSSQSGVLIVSLIGSSMLPWEQNALTEIALYVKRAHPADETNHLKPPPPLADPIVDSNVMPGEAFVYEVKAGEYIQILDVQGRECSDFQAFSIRDLDKGLEREIDPTATRTLGGTIYPTPGLYSKFFNVNFDPLVQIVQDTCGRHDAFGLACTAKYYEDMGYPGHKNCSTNMSLKLSHYEIREREGWPAINFFFNTGLDGNHTMMFDDPWSRPGDYVMLKALTDLVCVSTGCPCDIDSANGWNPTDIQVRTYGKDEDFKPSIGYRKSQEGDLIETKKTGFYESFAKHTRDFVEYSGYWLPNTIRNHGAISEYWACREKVILTDLSPLRKYEITGPDAEKLMQHCVTRDIRKLSNRQVVYTAMCYEHGGMIDDGTVFRLQDNFRWVGGNDESGLWLQKQARELGLNAWVRNSTDQLHNIAVQGPKSREVLQKVFWTPPVESSIEELGWFRFTVARIGGSKGIACVVSRTGYSGELGYEIFCHPKDATKVFDAVWDAGQEFGMIPFGLEALDLVRIEAGLIFAGYEFSDQTDPFEAGIGFTVPLVSQKDDFVGRKALERRKQNPARKLVGLEIETGLVPSNGDCIRLGKAQVGEITSAMKSPILGKTIALARMDITHSEIGTELEVGQLDGQQKRLKAKIVPFPHFDPEKKRVRGNYT